MNKFFPILFFSVAVIFFVNPTDLMAVKLNNVVQTGTGNSGSIKIEFNNDYNKSDITVNYAADRVDLTIPNAFVVPVKRIFKSSSTKASVVKIEAANISGRSLRLSIHFKGIPIDIIKKTVKLTGSGKVVFFNYGTVVEEPVVVKTQPEKQEQLPIVNTNDKIDIQADIKKIDAPVKVVTERPALLSTVKRYVLALAKFFKVAMLIVLLGLVVFALFYIVRKYSSNSYIKEKAIDRAFGSTKIQNDTAVNSGIRIISSLEMEKDKTLYVVEVMGEKMLIASGNGYTTMLSRLNNDSKEGQGSLFNDNNEQMIMKTRLKDRLNNI